MRFLPILLAALGPITTPPPIQAAIHQIDAFIRRDVYVFGEFVIDLNKMKARIGENHISTIQDCSTKEYFCLRIPENQNINAGFMVPQKCGSYQGGTVWHRTGTTTKIYAVTSITKGGFFYKSYIIGDISGYTLYLYSPEFGIIGTSSHVKEIKSRILLLKTGDDVESLFIPLVTFTKLAECRN